MGPKYQKGQRVVIVLVKNQRLYTRDSNLEPYSGQFGEVIDFYWINIGVDVPRTFYIYKVRIGDKDIVVHEDELEPFID